MSRARRAFRVVVHARFGGRDAAAGVHDATFGVDASGRLRDRAHEVRAQLERGEAGVGGQRRRDRATHRGVDQRRDDAAVHRAHRVLVQLVGDAREKTVRPRSTSSSVQAEQRDRGRRRGVAALHRGESFVAVEAAQLEARRGRDRST